MAKSRSKSNLFNKINAMIPSAIEVTPGENYVLSIVFDNGERGTLDMKNYLDFGLFSRLRDYDTFMTARISFDTIEWESGIDLDPEFVYSKCVFSTGKANA